MVFINLLVLLVYETIKALRVIIAVRNSYYILLQLLLDVVLLLTEIKGLSSVQPRA